MNIAARKIVLGLLGPVVFLLCWHLASSNVWVSPRLLPRPFNVAHVALVGMTSGVLKYDLLATLQRTLIATSIASLGIPLGVLLGSRPAIYGALEFLIEFFRSTPSTAMFPLGLLLFGIGGKKKNRDIRNFFFDLF